MLDQINLEQIPRSGFDLSYSTKGSGKIGRIIPTRCMECLPSDSIKGSTQAALQFQPLAVPILANMNVRQETWYVPNHILLHNWDTFITKGQDLSDNSRLPSFSLQDYVGTVFNVMNFTKTGSSLMNSFLMYGGFEMLEPMNGTKAVFGVLLQASYFTELVKVLRMSIDNDSSVAYALGKNQTDDLIDYRFELADQIESWFNTSATIVKVKPTGSSEYVNAVILSRLELDTTTMGSATSTSNKFVSYSLLYHGGDLSLATDYDLQVYKYFGSYFPSNSWLPSDDMLAFMSFMYDFFSPFFGVGSMMDYLGYNVLSPVDFNFAIMSYLYSKVGVIKVDGTNDTVFFDLSQMVSELSVSQQNILPLRACYAIWYNNYRDKLLETVAPEPVTTSVVSSDELFNISLLRIRAWSKDSFNTALANTGTGNMVVPISENLNGVRKEYAFAAKSTEDMLDLGMTQYTLADGSVIDLPTRYLSSKHTEGRATNQLKYEFSLDTLRRAGRTEKWIQKALIYGNLIQDALFTHWGVKIKNERIQLPEFVTSSSKLVKIDTILNNTTISSKDDSIQSTAGDKAGFASAYDEGTNFDWYSPENGYLISFMTVLPEQSYAYGKPRHLSKLRIFDFAFPEFAQIGMDAVYNEEIKLTGINAFNEAYAKGIFGYQGRYYDYKCKQDEEHGQLRTTDDMYTFSRDFNIYDVDSRPKLNYRFVHCHPSLDMFVVDDPSQDQFRYDIHHSVAASRALPVCGMSV